MRHAVEVFFNLYMVIQADFPFAGPCPILVRIRRQGAQSGPIHFFKPALSGARHLLEGRQIEGLDLF